MVFRLFVPPGEGQDDLVPKRPTILGANATLQYAIFSSTGLAAAYTSFANRYAQRVTPQQSVSRTALFVRSSARFGLWIGVAGAAANYYYHASFTSTVLSQQVDKVKKWKLSKRTKEYTVDDACLVGAAFGFAASVPMLILRRPNIPRLSCFLGLTNIGACAGMLGAHGYLQYTGARQKAYKRLDRRLQRRSLAFWDIFWDKELMARLDPLWQHYVRHQGLWYAQLLPDHVFEQTPLRTGSSKVHRTEEAPAQTVQEEQPFYSQPYDYAEDIMRVDTEATLTEMERLEQERANLLAEAEYLLFVNSLKQHAYCHTDQNDEDLRRRHMLEMQLIEITYNQLRAAAHSIDTRLTKWRITLQHKAACERKDGSHICDIQEWVPRANMIEFAEHQPFMSLSEMERIGNQLTAEVRRFEELCVDQRYTASQRERWRKDLEDGRMLLKAADQVAHELKKTLDFQAREQGKSSVESNSGLRDTASKLTPNTDAKSMNEAKADKKTLDNLPEPQKVKNGEAERNQGKLNKPADDRSKMGPNKP